jgi:hypothetical protein
MSSWFQAGGPAQLGVRPQAGGPAQYNQACKLSRNLFVDKLNIYLVGYYGTCYTYSWTVRNKPERSP